MDVRGKLAEILKQAPFEGKVLDEWWWEEKIKRIADHLIRNGVTVRGDGKPLEEFLHPVDTYKGLKAKYLVFKAETGERVENCFVLRPEKDPASVEALRAYASATDNETLAKDIYNWVGKGVTVRDKNDPITMDELRKMDGEPVWVSVSQNWRESGVSEGWCIVRFHLEDDRVRVYIYDTRHGGRFFSQQDYGISWWAYRQPPKGE